jgi:hypothetical protein
MMTKRERLKIVLLFLLLGPPIVGLMIGITLVVASSGNPIIHISAVLWFVLIAYPIGFIPAIVTGVLMQWFITRTMRRSISLSKAKWFLAGAFAGVAGSFSLIIFMIEFIIRDFSNGKSLGGLVILLVPGAIAGGICTLIALRKLRSTKMNDPDLGMANPSTQPET